jgi:ATP-binding cassette subfamily B protein RaxB
MGSALSGGQQQRLLLARALYPRPQILILDEATSHLDVATEQRIAAMLAELRITRVFAAHRPDTVAIATRVISLEWLAGTKTSSFRSGGNFGPTDVPIIEKGAIHAKS